MTENEQKLRTAALAVAGLEKDSMQDLVLLRAALIGMGAADNADGACALALVVALIQTHPEYTP